jgi:hypothetical protein
MNGHDTTRTTNKMAKKNVSLVYINMLITVKTGKSRDKKESKSAPKTDLTTLFIDACLSISLMSFLNR